MPAPLQTLEEQVEYLGVQRDAGCTPEQLELLATASKDSFLSVLADADGVQRAHATTMTRIGLGSRVSPPLRLCPQIQPDHS